MSFTVVIPARWRSERLPGKPLADIGGLPMIAHVCRRALASGAERVVVATDDARIAAAVPAPAEVVLTEAELPTGTDRIAAAASRLGLADDAVVVNVQGDEPLLPPEVIAQAAGLLAADPGARMATLCVPLTDAAQLHDPNVVKVAVGGDGEALWFSRAPLPWDRDGGGRAPIPEVHRRHLGIYAYRVGFLRAFVAWPQGRLERIEALEQLRALENRIRIRIADAVRAVPAGVDTQEDLERVRILVADGGAATGVQQA